jgi:hypothetical protein
MQAPGRRQQRGPALQPQAFQQQRPPACNDLQTGVAAPGPEVVTAAWAPQAEQVPGQQACARRKFEAAAQFDAGTAVQDAERGEPLQRGTRTDAEGLVLSRQRTRGAVELRCRRRGEQGVGPLRDTDVDLQPVPPDHASGRMQQIAVTGIALRVEDTLHPERADVAPMPQHGTFRAGIEAEFQPRPPTPVRVLRGRLPMGLRLHRRQRIEAG